MAADKQPGEQQGSVPSRSTVVLLLGTLADTTWRLFVPTIAGCIGGIYFDHRFDSTPWLTITGVIGGALLSGLLIYSQLKSIDKKGK